MIWLVSLTLPALYVLVKYIQDSSELRRLEIERFRLESEAIKATLLRERYNLDVLGGAKIIGLERGVASQMSELH